jgi:hypothetical protein
MHLHASRLVVLGVLGCRERCVSPARTACGALVPLDRRRLARRTRGRARRGGWRPVPVQGDPQRRRTPTGLHSSASRWRGGSCSSAACRAPNVPTSHYGCSRRCASAFPTPSFRSSAVGLKSPTSAGSSTTWGCPSRYGCSDGGTRSQAFLPRRNACCSRVTGRAVRSRCSRRWRPECRWWRRGSAACRSSSRTARRACSRAPEMSKGSPAGRRPHPGEPGVRRPTGRSRPRSRP